MSESWFSVNEKVPIAYAKVEVVEASDMKPSDLNGQFHLARIYCWLCTFLSVISLGSIKKNILQGWLIHMSKVNWALTDSGLRHREKLWRLSGMRNLRSPLLHGIHLICWLLKFVTRTILLMTRLGMLLSFRYTHMSRMSKGLF